MLNNKHNVWLLNNIRIMRTWEGVYISAKMFVAI